MRESPEPASTPGTDSPGLLESATRKSVAGGHGVTLAYWVLGDGPRTLLLANGLGGRLYAWEPLVRALVPGHRIITWDYRGLFESDTPERRRHLSILDHADDARRILDAEGVERAVACGWSMGVQVSLELAALAPERVAGLVLLNGTYGHAFQSGFQPLFPLPFVGRYGHRVIEYLVEHPEMTDRIAAAFRAMMTPTLLGFWLMSRTPMSRTRPLLERYREDVFQEKNFVNFLRMFQELDAHSVYHHLRDIEAPALIVSGAFDLLTPAYQSREIARRLPNARAIHLARASHFVLIERPEVVVPAVKEFLAEEVWRPVLH
jgi:pimeloyl-ACP methyl ester carboxylesterase